MRLFSNNLTIVLDIGVNAAATTFQLVTGHGALLPTITSPDYMMLTLAVGFGGTETNWEIVKVTGKSGDDITVVRQQEGSSALSWIAGDSLTQRITAGDMADMIQAGANKDVLVSQITIDDFATTYDVVFDSGGTSTLNFLNGNAAVVILTVNTTLVFINIPDAALACSFKILFVQDNIGGWTVTMPSGDPPTTLGTLDLNLDADKLTLASFVTMDGGDMWMVVNEFKQA